MQITKIIYKDDEATFMLKEERVLYALKINRKLDIPNEEVEELWYNYIKNNFYICKVNDFSYITS